MAYIILKVNILSLGLLPRLQNSVNHHAMKNFSYVPLLITPLKREGIAFLSRDFYNQADQQR